MNSGPEDPKPTTLTIKPTPGIETKDKTNFGNPYYKSLRMLMAEDGMTKTVNVWQDANSRRKVAEYTMWNTNCCM